MNRISLCEQKLADQFNLTIRQGPRRILLYCMCHVGASDKEKKVQLERVRVHFLWVLVISHHLLGVWIFQRDRSNLDRRCVYIDV